MSSVMFRFNSADNDLARAHKFGTITLLKEREHHLQSHIGLLIEFLGIDVPNVLRIVACSWQSCKMSTPKKRKKKKNEI
jgi:hypothetical protein